MHGCKLDTCVLVELTIGTSPVEINTIAFQEGV